MVSMRQLQNNPIGGDAHEMVERGEVLRGVCAFLFGCVSRLGTAAVRLAATDSCRVDCLVSIFCVYSYYFFVHKL